MLGAHLNWWAKIEFWGRPFWINIIVEYCSTRVLLYAKMLKETETEEAIVFLVTFLSLVAFQLEGGRAPCPPPGYAYAVRLPVQ